MTKQLESRLDRLEHLGREMPATDNRVQRAIQRAQLDPELLDRLRQRAMYRDCPELDPLDPAERQAANDALDARLNELWAESGGTSGA